MAEQIGTTADEWPHIQRSLVDDGDVVRVSGHVVFDDRGFGTIEPRQAAGQEQSLPVGAVTARQSPHVRITNLRPSDLPPARGTRPRTESWVEITGTWQGDSIQVRNCSPVGQFLDFWSPDMVTSFDWPGQWRQGGPVVPSPTEDLELELIHDGVIVSRKVLRVGPGCKVMAIAAMDPERVERLLRPSYGPYLRVWQSPWTSQAFWQATDELNENFERWELITVGDQIGDLGQSVVVASTIRLLPQTVSWLDEKPQGMVDLRPWIRPMRDLASSR